MPIFLFILIYTEWLRAFRVNHSNHSYLSWAHMNANPSGVYPSPWICILSSMGCMFLAGRVKYCLLFCETSLTSSILCEAGEEGRAYKGHTESSGPAAVPPGLRENMCVLELVLLSVPSAPCVVSGPGGWGRTRHFSLPKGWAVHIGRKFYLPKWLATGQGSTSRSEVFLAHISSWEFVVLAEVQYAACLIFYLSRQRNNCMRKVNIQ